MEKQMTNLVLIDTGANVTHASAASMSRLYFNLKLTESGELHRVGMLAQTQRSYLGIRELPLSISGINPARIAKDLLYEAERTQTLGVFADFERQSDVASSLLKEIDHALHENGIAFFVPVAYAHVTRHAVITFETAISGGSLSGRVEQLRQEHGERCLAAFIQPVSNDFSIPSNTADGKPLLEAERESLARSAEAQSFFSKELCAKYFTYADALGVSHFVLYDDGVTMRAKLSLLAGLGIETVFVLDQDAPPLLQQL